MAKQSSELTAFKAGLKTKAKGGKHHKSFTVPLGIVAGFVPLTITSVNAFQTGGVRFAGMELTRLLTGYDPGTQHWSLGNMKCGTGAILAGMGVHWLLGSKLGLNRMLARTGVPFIRI